MQLGARGIQVFTNVAGMPLSDPQFRPLFRRMAEHDLPVWVHPMRGPDFADYAVEKASQDEIWFSFGWPYETTACMTRLIYSGLFDELPQMKIISHHMGGMIPYFPGKINLGFRQIFFGTRDENPVAKERGLKKPPLDILQDALCRHRARRRRRRRRAAAMPFSARRIVCLPPTRRSIPNKAAG